MDVFVKLKSVGKRRLVRESTPYALPEGISTLRQLLEAVVVKEVEEYNSKGADNQLVPFLTEAQIEDQSTVGKVGFGRLYSERKADPIKAVEVALQGFEDGLFRVLIGEAEATKLDSPLELNEGDTLTFIRLTFLAGRMW